MYARACACTVNETVFTIIPFSIYYALCIMVSTFSLHHLYIHSALHSTLHCVHLSTLNTADTDSSRCARLVHQLHFQSVIRSPPRCRLHTNPPHVSGRPVDHTRILAVSRRTECSWLPSRTLRTLHLPECRPPLVSYPPLTASRLCRICFTTPSCLRMCRLSTTSTRCSASPVSDVCLESPTPVPISAAVTSSGTIG